MPVSEKQQKFMINFWRSQLRQDLEPAIYRKFETIFARCLSETGAIAFGIENTPNIFLTKVLEKLELPLDTFVENNVSTIAELDESVSVYTNGKWERKYL